jgi:hypothetical protein
MHMIKKRHLVVEEGDEGSLRPNCSTTSQPNQPQTGATAPARPPEQNLRHSQFVTNGFLESREG